jgi:hypothetical protein
MPGVVGVRPPGVTVTVTVSVLRYLSGGEQAFWLNHFL